MHHGSPCCYLQATTEGHCCPLWRDQCEGKKKNTNFSIYDCTTYTAKKKKKEEKRMLMNCFTEFYFFATDFEYEYRICHNIGSELMGTSLM